MNTKQTRDQAIQATIIDIKSIMNDGVTVERLEQAKSALMALCEKKELFTLEDFPGPSGNQTERTFLVYEDENGEYALYVNSGGPDQNAPPHDHGGSWAIIAAVFGEETHRLYVDDAAQGNSTPPALRQACEIMVKPGTAVSMLPDGIHSIHGASENLMHLHLYGLSFESQMERKTYDLERGTVRRFMLEDVGFVEDAR